MTTQESPDFDRVTQLIEQYFIGLHTGDVALLNSLFHDDAVLKAPGLRRSKSEWLNAVANRDIPQQLDHPFDYRILALDIVGSQAMVKVLCPLLGHRYVDFLGLLKEDGQWLLVNKMYADEA